MSLSENIGISKSSAANFRLENVGFTEVQDSAVYPLLTSLQGIVGLEGNALASTTVAWIHSIAAQNPCLGRLN